MRKKSLVVFDWDGTLINSTKRNHYALSVVFQRIFGRDLPLSLYRAKVDFPVKNMLHACGIGAEELHACSEERERVFKEHYDAWPHSVGLLPGARKLLHWLRAHQIPCVIVSNHERHLICDDLKRLHISSFFREVSGRPSDLCISHASNKPERVRAILKKHGIDASRAVIIGDTRQEIQIARDLGMRVISVGCGDTLSWRLARSKPDAIISTPAHAIPVLSQWFNHSRMGTAGQQDVPRSQQAFSLKGGRSSGLAFRP